MADVQPYADYRRQARHIRKLYADQPHRLYHYLGRLAKDEDLRRPATAQFTRSSAPIVQRVRRVESPFPATLFGPELSPQTVAIFSELITDRFDGPVLRYSQRTALLRKGHRLGIGRFHANLIIALTQHRHCANLPAAMAVEATTIEPRRSRLIPILAALIIQTAIVAGLWLLMR